MGRGEACLINVMHTNDPSYADKSRPAVTMQKSPHKQKITFKPPEAKTESSRKALVFEKSPVVGEDHEEAEDYVEVGEDQEAVLTTCAAVDDDPEVINECAPEVTLADVRRQMPGSAGLYAEGQLQGVDVIVTVDTGASITLISNRAYREIPEEKRPDLTRCQRMVISAEGKTISCLGEGNFDLFLGDAHVKLKAMVAEISDEVLLGVDVLLDPANGPADILLKSSHLIVGSHKIPLFTCVRRARAAEDFIVPAMSEVIVDAFVDAMGADTNICDILVESSPATISRTSLLVAPCVVHHMKTPTVHLQVLNPSSEPISIQQDQVIGIAQHVDVLDRQFSEVRRLDTDPVIQPSSAGSNDVPDHLKILLEQSVLNKTKEESDIIRSLLIRYEDCFSRHENDLGLTHLAEHEIDTGTAKPIKQAPRRTPLAFINEDRQSLEKLQAQGAIRPSMSPWASAVVFVRKRNGKVRLCVDYRQLNVVTKKDAFPLPRIQDCLDAVAGASLFSTMDITSAYNQVPVRVEDIPKTAFVTKYGLFEYLTMPFGLSNAPATFQRVMEMALHGLQWSTCLIYLDDIVVHAQSFLEHVTRLEGVLQRIRASGLKLSPEKCYFLKSSVAFLGHVVSAEGVQPNQENIEKLKDWPKPTCATDIRAFLGLANYYRRHIQNFAKRVRPLVKLTCKDKPFIWDEECEKAIEDIKHVLTSAPIMAFPLDEGDFILDTDACDVSIGAVLSQVQEGVERVIAYGSKALAKAEHNYCVTDKELLAVKHFVMYYRHYLLGRRFTVRSDHIALKWLFGLRDPKSRVARWIEILSEYDFEVQYRPGPRHGNADGMSRCPDPRKCQCPGDEELVCGPCDRCAKRSNPAVCRVETRAQKRQTEDAVQQEVQGWPVSYTPIQLRTAQLDDPDLGPVIKWIESGAIPSSTETSKKSPATRHHWCDRGSLRMVNGVLQREFCRENGVEYHMQIVVPQSMRPVVLHQMHQSLLGGHLGRHKTREKTLQRFYWFGARTDIDIWVAKCDICASIKPPCQKPRGPLGTMTVFAPLDRIATDLMGPLPLTSRGNRYVLAVTDYFTKCGGNIPRSRLHSCHLCPDYSQRSHRSFWLSSVFTFGSRHEL